MADATLRVMARGPAPTADVVHDRRAGRRRDDAGSRAVTHHGARVESMVDALGRALGVVGQHRPHEYVRRVPAKQPGRGGSQCLSASEKGSSAAGQEFLPPAAFLRVREPGMYPECQVKRAPRRRSLGRVAPPLGPAAPIGEHASLAPPPLRGCGYAHVAAVHPAAPHGRAPAFADPADGEEQD